MRITNKETREVYNINATRYTPTIEPSYRLIELSGSAYRSIDRGASTDVFKTTLTVRRNESDVRAIYDDFRYIMINQVPLTLSNIEEPIFSDVVDISSPIDVLIEEITGVTFPVKNVGSFDIVLVAKVPNLIGVPIIPNKLNCLQNNYSSNENHKHDLIYTNGYTKYKVYRDCYKKEFTGQYLLNSKDTRNMLMFLLTKRGNKFTAINDDWGGVDLFNDGAMSSSVRVKEFTLTHTSKEFRQLDITLLKEES